MSVNLHLSSTWFQLMLSLPKTFSSKANCTLSLVQLVMWNLTIPVLAIFMQRANYGIYFWIVGASKYWFGTTKVGQFIFLLKNFATITSYLSYILFFSTLRTPAYFLSFKFHLGSCLMLRSGTLINHTLATNISFLAALNWKWRITSTT